MDVKLYEAGKHILQSRLEALQKAGKLQTLPQLTDKPKVAGKQHIRQPGKMGWLGYATGPIASALSMLSMSVCIACSTSSWYAMCITTMLDRVSCPISGFPKAF